MVKLLNFFLVDFPEDENHTSQFEAVFTRETGGLSLSECLSVANEDAGC